MWGSSSEGSDVDDDFYMHCQNDCNYDLPKSTEEFDLKTPANVLTGSLLAALDKNPLQATVADQIRTSEDYNDFVFSQSQQSQKGKRADTAENANKINKRIIVPESGFKKINEKHGKKQYTNDAIALDRNPLQVTVPDQIQTAENYNDFVFSQTRQSQMDDATIKKKKMKENSCAENTKEKVLDGYKFGSPRLESDNAVNDLTNQLFSQFRNVSPINNSNSEIVSQSESILTIDTVKLTQMSAHLDELQCAKENNEKNKLKNNSNMNAINELSMEDIDDIVNTTFKEFSDKVIKTSPKKRKSKTHDKRHKKTSQVVVESWIQQIESNDGSMDNLNKIEDGNAGNKENIDETINRNKKNHRKHNRSKERSDSAKKPNRIKSKAIIDTMSDSDEDVSNKQVTVSLKSVKNLESPEQQCKTLKKGRNEENLMPNLKYKKNIDETVKGKKKNHKKSNSCEENGKQKKCNKSDSMSQSESAGVEENLMPNLKIKDNNDEPIAKNINNPKKKRDHSKENLNNENADFGKGAIKNNKIKSKHSHSAFDYSYIDSESVDEIVSSTKKRKITPDSTDIVMSVTREEDDENVHKKCKKLKKHKKKKRKLESFDSDCNLSRGSKKLKVEKIKLTEDRKLIEKPDKEQKLLTNNKIVSDEKESSHEKCKSKLNTISTKNNKFVDNSSNKEDEDNFKYKSKKSKSKLKEKSNIISKQIMNLSFNSDDQVIASRISKVTDNIVGKKDVTEKCNEIKINGQNLDELINEIINESCSQIDVTAKLLDSTKLSPKKSSKNKNKDKQDTNGRKDQFYKKHKKIGKTGRNDNDCLSQTYEVIEETKSVQHEKENEETEHSMKKKLMKSKKEKKEEKKKHKGKKVLDESEKAISENCDSREKQDNTENVTFNNRQNEANITDSEPDLIHINKNYINNEESGIACSSNFTKDQLGMEIEQEYKDEFLDETNNIMNETAYLSEKHLSEFNFLPVSEELVYVKLDYELTAEDEEILRCLTFYSTSKVPPLHQLQVNVTRLPPKEVMAQIKKSGLEYKSGTYNPDETKLILNNWHKFCKKHRIPRKPELFMNLNQKDADNKLLIAKKDALIFTQWLARGLPNRLLCSVYNKFKTMFRSYKQGKYTPEEDKIIVETVTSSKNTRGIFIRLGILLDRDPNGVEKHWIALRENEKHAFKVERIGTDEAANIVKTLMEVMGCQHVGELKNNNIPIKIFTEVGEKLHVRPLKIQQYWYNNLHPKLFVTGTRSVLQVKMQLLKLILANPEYTLLQHVDYNKLLPEMDGWTTIALGKMLRNILHWNAKLQKGQAFREQLEICLTDLRNSPDRLQLKVARFENGELHFADP